MSVRGRGIAALFVVVLIVGCEVGGPAAPPSHDASDRPPTAATTGGTSPVPVEEPTPAPTTPAPATPTPTAPPASYSFVCEEDETEEEPECLLHRTDARGNESDGWPIELPSSCFDEVAATEDGGVFLGCDRGNGSIIHGLMADGRPMDGWPIEYPEPLIWGCSNDFGLINDAILPLISLSRAGDLLVLVGSERSAELWAIQRDGEPRDGWPRPAPGDGCPGFAEATDGTILAWGYEGFDPGMTAVADRTVFTAFTPDGRTKPGWPRGSKGAASGPIVEADGGIIYVSERGKVWRHAADGEIVPGWPYELPAPAAPSLRPDGRLSFLVMGDDSDVAIVLEEDGDSALGWPVDLGGHQESWCLFGDTPCSGDVPPTYWPGGSMAVALAPPLDDDGAPEQGGSIVVVDRDGRIVAGWPFTLEGRAHAQGLAVDDDDNLVVDVLVCPPDYCDPEASTKSTIRLGPDGVVLEGSGAG